MEEMDLEMGDMSDLRTTPNMYKIIYNSNFDHNEE